MADDLDDFLEWCAKRGHYTTKQLAENYRAYLKELAELELQARQDQKEGRNE